ncbi:hypothetical protein Marpi_1562 [Marinitoga piezophila KA3]|uniref:Rho termination factor N-terminal domain-containing protein n=1 Tax=Marinitoga piezophila (strain DSM 14283 / JCM 11233 / KA3) TaxID=443254 RepID=H2J4L0_MARPK|nr:MULTISPECIES: DUF4912 domain-containing protein [Marinitoga]AEX85952.1 hypothetical protein Marpi_1562 [Marinitoga piezophila KA3]APT76379.1 hypothetical protein LN42_08320 [Marinitoga sp. 1137]
MIIDKKLSMLLENDEPSIQELRNIAKNMGIKLKRSMRKKDIIKVIKNKLLQLKEEGLITDPTVMNSFTTKSINKNSILKYGKKLNKNILVITSVNANWVHAFWEFSNEIIEKLNKISESTKLIMRFYDITGIEMDIDVPHRTYEYPNDLKEYTNYYFYLPVPNKEYIAELGYFTQEKEFIAIIRSNRVKMPSDKPNFSESVYMYNLKTGKKRKIKHKKEFNIIEKISGVSNGNMIFSQLGDKPPISGGGSFIWNLYSLNRGIKK